ncbi:MAG: DUF4856 domain-containing protein [Euryarchaeota archaeon]|nr:DUF4856 domain-containing protein [Euryarchaeota archaeon]|tara:strand:- start:3173 stop:4321 length:1149 start_codon:yes stop_codon:yes gene_type:complete
MKNLNKLWVLFIGVIFIACDEETTDPVITVTPPATYAFERNGTTTVSYGGQSSRLEMAGELSVWLNTPTKTKTELVNMFDNGAGFGNPALAASGKKLGNKTAASSQASSTVKPQFDAMIDDVTSNVFPAVNSATDASAGVAGVYTDAGDGGRTVKINGKGHEINQLFTKGLMGALVCDQIIWGYLTAGKLDAGTNKADNDAGTVVEGKNYTQMEHYWDEGFGYLYGLDTDISNSSIEGQDVLVSKYLKKVDGSSLPGIAQELYDAFKHGRAAIVAGAYDVRDEQAEIVKTKLSHIIGRKAADYLRSGAGKINDGKWADAHHALSEGWGFILSLQFTKNPTTGAPYYSNSEVNDMLTQIDDFWTVTPANLETMAAGIESKFGF